MQELPETARAVVIGGGIIGCSTAYHLAKMGWTDTVVLERRKLTSGSTFHAAGLVGQLRTSANITQMLGYSVDLYNRIEEETGLATGWKMNGGLRLACNSERWIEVKRQATTARSFGLDMHLLSPGEAQDLWPLMDVQDVVGAAILATDGQANPSDITQALARGARMAGVRILEDTCVTAIETSGGSVRAVMTPVGRISCEKVVCCAGQWTRELAARVGVNVPLVSVQHQYMVTEPIDGVTTDLPTLRDPDRLTYYKEEVGGLVMGGYESDPLAWAVDGIPEDFHFSLLDPDFDHFRQLVELASGRVPALEHAGVKQLINGPESFTPDGNFILGEAPGLRGFFVGAGFNAFGIASAGGAGMALAEWVHGGEPPFDLWPVDIRRFGSPHFDLDWVRHRTHEAYGKHYTIAWPQEEHRSARPWKKPPLYRLLEEEGACFGEKLGWERANWFADRAAGEVPEDRYSFGRQNWLDAVGREARAAREAAVLIDQSSFAKFLLRGPDAGDALSRMASNDVARPPGSLVYTQMLNDLGGIECDLVVARLSHDTFYIVTGTGLVTHDFDWIRRNIPEGIDATLEDVTNDHATLSLMGPNSRAILEETTNDDVSNAAFPFGQVRAIDISGSPVRALRVSYVGELGWELHCPVDHAVPVFEAVRAAGRRHGLRLAGYRAIEALRLEKGYRAWGSDIGPDHTPLEAGMGWAVKLASNTPFRGREALERQKREGVTKMLAGFTVDDPDVVLIGRETIYRNGEIAGWLTSGGFGYTVNKAIGYGYVRSGGEVDREYVLNGSYELEVATERIPARVHLTALHDPAMTRLKA